MGIMVFVDHTRMIRSAAPLQTMSSPTATSVCRAPLCRGDSTRRQAPSLRFQTRTNPSSSPVQIVDPDWHRHRSGLPVWGPSTLKRTCPVSVSHNRRMGSPQTPYTPTSVATIPWQTAVSGANCRATWRVCAFHLKIESPGPAPAVYTQSLWAEILVTDPLWDPCTRSSVKFACQTRTDPSSKPAQTWDCVSTPKHRMKMSGGIIWWTGLLSWESNTVMLPSFSPVQMYVTPSAWTRAMHCTSHSLRLASQLMRLWGSPSWTRSVSVWRVALLPLTWGLGPSANLAGDLTGDDR
mmetsp:Transcript_124898/g.216508  ORF Transcript_124898/g.216508 Transcript_124898/m.216508 type:complete len:294 (+) Transcript_124898:452-1333(+)